jgi:hypothetical protein
LKDADMPAVLPLTAQLFRCALAYWQTAWRISS